MGYYITFDGGGSKCIAILFDDKLNLISTARAGALNANTGTKEECVPVLRECFSKLFEAVLPQEIETLFLCSPAGNSWVYEILQESSRVKSAEELTEGEMALLSAEVGNSALVALAGTGINLSHYVDGKSAGLASGWGALLYDGGSGFSVGRCAMQAAIADFEGYGSPTLLTETITQHFQAARFDDVRSILYTRPSPVREIAALAPLVQQCSDAGDEAAREALHWNALQLKRQICGYITQHPECLKMPIVTAGGAWKLHTMREDFCCSMRKTHANLRIVFPRFEPVMGGVLLYARRIQAAKPLISDTLAERFSLFLVSNTLKCKRMESFSC